jgi:GcrA cell cycle regulator
MIWTDERVALLKKLWLLGISASMIAEEMGCGLTRNAVLGKIHRNGFAPRPIQLYHGPHDCRAKPRKVRPALSAMPQSLQNGMAPVLGSEPKQAQKRSPIPVQGMDPKRIDAVIVPASTHALMVELETFECSWQSKNLKRDFSQSGTEALGETAYIAPAPKSRISLSAGSATFDRHYRTKTLDPA